MQVWQVRAQLPFPVVPLRDPRPLASALVVMLAVAAIAQVARVGLRAAHYRDAVAIENFMLDPDNQVGDTLVLTGVLELQLAELVLITLVLLPSQVAAGVLWFLWQRRIRRNAAQLRGCDAAATRRRIWIVASVVVAWVVAEAAQYVAAISEDAARPGKTGVAFELTLDLIGLALVLVVGITALRWTRDQDRLVRARA